ncbi:MAG TPA: elongation factor G [Bacillota bacterium]|mgnify:FL=1|nr:elongation factor G [Bacillota bacterium]HRS21805.1 elongation factor G [Clostridia bacterium]HOS68600.1 elongation factor G [Bacillota bacterium]HQE65812.1 elongation factor G [Bacillota bacterium]HQI16077.1 elongation factor G [Bacillota bacterium]
MKDHKTENLRNIGLFGHGSAGKTTIAEAMLFNTGVLDRFGKVDDGNTVTDFDPEEIKRKISISAATAPCDWKECRINAIDTPGYFDFVGEAVASLKVVDGAIIALDSIGGVEVGAEKAWDFVTEGRKACMFFVNKLDRENASFSKVVEQLRGVFGNKIVPFALPIGSEASFKGIVDIIDMKAKIREGNKTVEGDIPAELKAEAEEYRNAIIEAAAQTDEELMEKYFGGEELSREEIIKGLRLGVVAGDVAPVLCGAAVKNIGIDVLMDTVVNFMPSPADSQVPEAINSKSNEKVKIPADVNAPFSAQVYKTIADPFVGKISMFKVMSGKLTADMEVLNSSKEKKEKLSSLFLLRGKKQVAVDKLVAGDIAAVAKLQFTTTGDTLCDANNPVVFDPIQFPAPSISMAIEPKAKGDEDKIGSGLQRLVEEDPTLKVEKNTETKQTLISGMGEQHLEVVTKKLQNKFGVEVVLKDPKIPFRETIRKSAKAEGKHKKQSGGHGQYGHVWIEFEPILDGSADFEFVDKIVGGVVPRQYIPAVEKGLRECIEEGVLAGYPVVNLRCTLYDGSFHPVDSAEMPFKIAASLAYKKGMAAASPVLLEPIYHVEVLVPDEYMGDIIGDLNKKRGRILGMEPCGKMQKVSAEAPLAEMFKYATDLRSMTQARGSFTMEFERYEEVPAQIAQKIIEAANAEREKE